jgi:GxxExxY protein
MLSNKKPGPNKKFVDLLYKDEVYAIVGAAIEVHKQLGSGFLEAIYQEALEIELETRHIPFEPQKTFRVVYKGQSLKKEYMADFVCYDKIIVEIKALNELSGREESQVLNYLKVSGLRLGLLINFGSVEKLEWKRLIL